MDIDLAIEPLGEGADGEPVYLQDVWPSSEEVKSTVAEAIRSDMFTKSYDDVFTGDDRWRSLEIPEGDRYEWSDSTYVRRPPFFDDIDAEPSDPEPIKGARALAVLGDSVTTDHISPAGAIKKDSPAGRWLIDNGVDPRDFNSYGSRRGNHEVMVRGTFANIRLRNQLVSKEGGYTVHFPDGEETTIYEAAMRYAEEDVPLIVLAGKEYGSGSSRDWAAKGTALLGVRAVLAESFERIHRSNLIGMGVLPLQLPEGESVESLGLSGEEVFDVEGIPEATEPDASGTRTVRVKARGEGDEGKELEARVRLDTPKEVAYYRNGGILQHVLRQLR
jgi:aconitate hydratase